MAQEQPNTSSVEIVEVCRVAPPPVQYFSASTSTNQTPNTLPLTFFDLRYLRFPQFQRLFFYEIPTPTTSTSTTNTTTTYSSFFDSILPRLKRSLSLTIHHFLPLAGNLIWHQNSPQPVVVYAAQDDAVSLTVAQYSSTSTSADFHHLSATDELSEATACHPLVPNLAASHERASILAVQVTYFPNCGFSIGITINHAVLDGQTLNMFMKAWSHTCRSLAGAGDQSDDHDVCLPLELKPVYERSNIFENPTMAKLGAIFSDQWLQVDGPNNRSLLPWASKVEPETVRGTFQFPRAKIEKLRRLIMQNDIVVDDDHDHDHQHHPYLSSFTVTCAYTWVCLVKTEEEEVRVNDTKMVVVLAADCRSRLEPPLPTTYLGNCVGSRDVVAEKEELLGKLGLNVAVNAIRRAVKSLEIKGQLLNGAENWVKPIVQGFTTGSAVVPYVFGSSPRFEVYGTDFGWGRPRKVDVVSVDRMRIISVSDTRNCEHGGLEIGLALTKHRMKAFASFFAQGLESL